MICPYCGNLITYNSFFDVFYCSKCGGFFKQATVMECNDLNEPLTLDELRQMDGEPVWVSVSNNWRESGVSEGWCIVRFHSEDDRVRVYVYDTRHGARFFAQQDYGESWIAYRQKPEEGRYVQTHE